MPDLHIWCVRIICNISEILQIIYLLTQTNNYHEPWCISSYCFLTISIMLNVFDIFLRLSIGLNLSCQFILLFYLVKLDIKNIYYIILIVISLMHLLFQIKSYEKSSEYKVTPSTLRV